MFSIKEIIGDVRNWVVGYLMGGFLIGIFVVLRAVWAAMKREPLPWALLLVLSLIAIALFGVAIVNFIRTAKRHGKAQIPESNPEIELQSEGGLISARVTNRSDSEVRVEHLWIAAVDATGKKTLAKDRIRKFTRCAQMPHVMPPRSSFEAIFNLSEAGFHSHAQAHPSRAVTEYWIEVKLEDGTVVSSDHRQIITHSIPPLGLRVSYHRDSQDCMWPVTFRTKDGKVTWEGVIARLRVDCETESDISECKAVITSLEKNARTAVSGVQLPLLFTPAQDLGSDIKTIKYGQPEYLELLWIPNSGEAEIMTNFPFAFAEHKTLDRLSTYSLHVAFSVVNIITKIIVDAEYRSGTWMLSMATSLP